MNSERLENMVKEFKIYTDRINAIQSALNLFVWDMSVDAPKGGTASRAKYMGLLAAEAFALRVSDEMRDFLEALEAERDSLDDAVRAMTRICRRQYDAYQKVPVEEIREYSELTAKAGAVWEKAKAENDFAGFAPTLEQIVRYQIKFAEYRGYEGHRYNTLLDDYEPGMTVEKLDRFFDRLKAVIVPLLKSVQASEKKINADFLQRSVSLEKQKQISELLMEKVGYDLNRGMLRENEHPFTDNMGKNDVRITTHYHENAFLSAFYSVLHECGHALYEQNKMDAIADTILDTGVSMGIHESQSRFYENMIGRSEAFWENIYDDLIKILGADFKDLSARDFYEASNIARPSLIRIEADELTYSLHIMVRYEIEKILLSGGLDVYDLPRLWSEKMREYLGVEPDSDARGVLQDVHWSEGYFGYFPSYALGNAYAAQILHAMRKDIDFEGSVRSGRLPVIQKWLAEKIHQYGSLKTPSQLIQDVTGEELNADYYTLYLKNKFSLLYTIH
ncbi:MAG: carboxypeptidase M32 [Clostridiales bacterium]|nr:carboxypeptidase M32 [Clostridiales bacterium]